MKRYITLVTMNEYWSTIENWCRDNAIPLVDKYRERNLHYFNMKGSTETYEKLKADIPGVFLTGYAEIGNILDCDSEMLSEFYGIMEAQQAAIERSHSAEHWLVMWMLKTDSIDALNKVLKYSDSMTDVSVHLIKERIKTLTGEPDDYEKQLGKRLEEEN